MAREFNTEISNTMQPRSHRLPRKQNSPSIDAWLGKQRMSNENLFITQQVQDGEILSLEQRLLKAESRMRWIEFALAVVIVLCMGLVSCLI